MALPKHNFHAQTHRELYDRIHKQDKGVVEKVETAWYRFRAVIGDAKAELESAIHSAEAVWIGAAGERFTSANAPLVRWTEQLREAGVATHRSFQSQHSHYTGALYKMPEPVQVTSTANDDFWGVPGTLTHLVGGQTDQDAQEHAANEAKREAVRVMEGYQEGAASSAHGLGLFVPPPSTTTEVDATPIATPPQVQASSTPPPSSPGASQPFFQSAPPPEQPANPPAAPQGTTERSSVSAEAPQHSPPTPSATTPPTSAQHPAQGFTVLPRIVNSSPAGTTFTAAAGNPAGITGRLNPTASSGSGTTHSTTGSPSTRSPSGHATPSTPSAPGGGHGTRNLPGAGPSAPPQQQATRLPTSTTPPPSGMAALPPNGRAGEHDQHHKSASYLEELRDVWGADSIPKVSPPVIGDDRQ